MVYFATMKSENAAAIQYVWNGWDGGGNSHIVLVLIVVLNNDGFLSFLLIIIEVTYLSNVHVVLVF